jgi:pimeloyl-ACP methyl ester carboxylesterase
MLGDQIPGAERRELPCVAHLPPMEDPQGFAREVLAFLAGTVSP